MADPIRQAIPTPEQIQAIAAGFGRRRPSSIVILPKRFSSLRQWLLAPAHDPEHFGRKRRARRARGRRIEAKRRRIEARRNRPYVGGRIWLARATFARVRAGGAPLPKVMMLDEVDSFPTEELTVAQWAAARRTMQGQRDRVDA